MLDLEKRPTVAESKSSPVLETFSDGGKLIWIRFSDDFRKELITVCNMALQELQGDQVQYYSRIVSLRTEISTQPAIYIRTVRNMVRVLDIRIEQLESVKKEILKKKYTEEVEKITTCGLIFVGTTIVEKTNALLKWQYVEANMNLLQWLKVQLIEPLLVIVRNYFD